MLKTNADKLVKISVQGGVGHPFTPPNTEYNADVHLKAMHTPTMGGIVYNFQIGDCCIGLKGDHTEPGVSTENPDIIFNGAYNTYSCIGNKARVITGDAKGAIGYVTGKHGAVEHVMLWFPQDVLEKLTCSDQFLVQAYGYGLTLEDYPEVSVSSVAPELLEAMGIREENGQLVVPVAKKIPSYMMGAGKGHTNIARGDYDLMSDDRAEMEKLGMNDLRFGDIVLLEDEINIWGRRHEKGGATVGVIIHGDSDRPGHGPGITTILSAKGGVIRGEIDPEANLKFLFPKMKGYC